MSITLGAATKFLDEMMTNYSQWHTKRDPTCKRVNSIEKIFSLSEKVDMIMSMLATNQSSIDHNNVPLASIYSPFHSTILLHRQFTACQRLWLLSPV